MFTSYSISCCRRGIALKGRWIVLFAVPYFFDLHPFSPSCVPIRNFLCKVSFWRFKLPHEPGLTKAKKLHAALFLPFVTTEPNVCLPLPTQCGSTGKIERAHRALNGMQLKKYSTAGVGKISGLPNITRIRLIIQKFKTMRQSYLSSTYQIRT